MPYPTGGNLGPAFEELSAIANESATLNARATTVLDGIRDALIGQHVIQYGRRWQISQVQVWGSARVTCYGVTVSKKGKVGTRGFDLGLLENCRFVSEPR